MSTKNNQVPEPVPPSSKDAMEASWPGPAEFRLAKFFYSTDEDANPGEKKYCAFRGDSRRTAILYAKDTIRDHEDKDKHGPCLYEVVPHEDTTPVYLILDLERTLRPEEVKGSVANTSARWATWTAVRGHVESLLSSLTGSDIKLFPGYNCQLKESLASDKFSMHLLVYCPGLTMLGCRYIARELHSRCMKLLPNDPLRALLVHPDDNSKSIFCQDIYTSPPSICLLGCTPRRSSQHDEVCMTAALSSTEDLEAHLVCIDLNTYTPPCTLPPLSLPSFDSCEVRQRSAGAGAAGAGHPVLTAAAIGGGAGAATAGVAVTAAINAVGFTSAGISAGSTAAAMMAAEAVAAGGAISSGGVVATLQSIGAVGLVGGPAVGVAVAGAVLGVAVVGGVTAAVRWGRGRGPPRGPDETGAVHLMISPLVDAMSHVRIAWVELLAGQDCGKNMNMSK
eukprot:gene14852-20909_t